MCASPELFPDKGGELLIDRPSGQGAGSGSAGFSIRQYVNKKKEIF